MIPGLSDIEERDLILSVGTHRSERRLSPVEIAELFDRAMKSGVSRDQLAERCLLENTTIIGRFLSLLDLAPVVQHLVSFGTGVGSISFTAGKEIARVGDQESQAVLAERTLQDRLTSAEVRAVVQKMLRSGASIEDSADAIVELRVRVERQYVYIAGIEESEVSVWLAEMTQLQRDEILREFLSTWSLSADGHLGDKSFTLVADEAGAGGIEISVVEKHLNQRLMELRKHPELRMD